MIFELDEILREYARGIVTKLVSGDGDRLLAKTRERILEWIEKSLNPEEEHKRIDK